MVSCSTRNCYRLSYIMTVHVLHISQYQEMQFHIPIYSGRNADLGGSWIHSSQLPPWFATTYICADAIVCVAGLQVKLWTWTVEKQPLEVIYFIQVISLIWFKQWIKPTAVSKSWKPMRELEKQHFPALLLPCRLKSCYILKFAAKEMPASKKHRFMQQFR